MSNPDTIKQAPTGLALIREFKELRGLRGTGHIHALAWSPDGKTLAISGTNNVIQLWNLKTGRLMTMFKKHKGEIISVAWSPDGKILVSSDIYKNCYLWDLQGHVMKVFEQDILENVACLAWSPNGRTLALGSVDKTVHLWDAEASQIKRTLTGHTNTIKGVAWSPNGEMLVTASLDKSVSIWDPSTGDHLRSMEGHTDAVNTVAWSKDGEMIVTGSKDRTLRLWAPKSGKQKNVLEAHTDEVTSVSFSCDGRILASKSTDATVRLWRCDSWQTVTVQKSRPGCLMSTVAFQKDANILAMIDAKGGVEVWNIDIDSLLAHAMVSDTIHYINAKAVLVGESGVGKSGLGIRIADKRFRPTLSTHGAQFWQLPVPKRILRDVAAGHLQADLILWDLAGQSEYHLIHQLFLDDTDVALLLFDCSDATDPFRGVPFWAKALKKHISSNAVKLLVSARCDVSPVTVDPHEINRFLAKYDLHGYVSTSAKTGKGVRELATLIFKSIPWNDLPRTTTPRLFQVIRDLLLERKEAGERLVPISDIWRSIKQRHAEEGITQAQIDTVINLLQARGLVYQLTPTPRLTWVLLQPEQINRYASSIIQAARNNPGGIGAIPERDVVCANLPLIGFERLEPHEEKIVLESTVELLIRHDLCFREMGMLVFPSQLNKVRPAYGDEHPPTEVTYQFSGSVESIYASLVVRLSYTRDFQREHLWKYAAEFSRNGDRLGFSMYQVEEGTSELEIYFYPGVKDFDRVTFIRFITDHLYTKGINIEERIRLYCPKCKNEVQDRAAIEARVVSGKLDITCSYCDASILIPRSIEERYRSDRAYGEKQQQLNTTVERRTRREIKEFKQNQRLYIQEQDQRLHILHLSDIHVRTASEARKYRTQLETDLTVELGVHRLEYLIISGDITDHSTPDEYKAAFELVDGIVKRFGLDPERVIVVPGNHDVNWDLSAEAYHYMPKHKLPSPLTGAYIPAGDAGALLRDDGQYRQRFAHFNSHFYKKVYGGKAYPTDYKKQAILYLRPDDRLLFLGLNSVWELDHHYRQRASINMEALAYALNTVMNISYKDWLKVAVWHHPVTGREGMNDEFLQLLAIHGFKLGMHGHIHEAIDSFYKYDVSRNIHIIGAGTFGAPANEQVTGIPLQYNLLLLDKQNDALTVETRKKEKPDGAWSADARWGDKKNPSPRYLIQL